jgi:hypothetical protein
MRVFEQPVYGFRFVKWFLLALVLDAILTVLGIVAWFIWTYWA